jgi:Ca-activated chloride channel family protein
MSGGWWTFHLLRPWWLLATLPAVCLIWALHRREEESRGPGRLIAPHLRTHLIVGQDRRSRLRPGTVLPVVWALAIVALAGPAWRIEPSPFGSEQAPLVVVLKVTTSMEAADVAPARLDRARYKLRDLLGLRPAALTALVAYAGSAHLVVPCTRDGRLVEQMADALSPAIMPREGDDLPAALALARAELSRVPGGGSILIVADGAPRGRTDTLRALRTDDAPLVQWLAVLPSPELGAQSGVAAAAHDLGAVVRYVTPDDSDVRAVQRRAALARSGPPVPGVTPRWHDEGYALVPLVAAGLLLWARRGWSLA